ncbi:hypothetical protein CGJ07_24250 [Vibrio parahaemolyticus]|uniref:hypothetical protein n=3 Tax=Vibrionaceae TaxID=641 RepID=UPI00116C41BF|nr:hypothetical protein [Vibrio parahaemolyticus]EKP4406570.1 hypothetical protein [Vibrio parahaemolyticus]TOG15510.1 hypothetical protein CGJ07_24250 [Vibrio parahaemolyticus]HCG6029193.1 hypothetical protein [Vibrio parahaemolyticus]
MPYCHKSLVITPQIDTSEILNILSRTKFNAWHAVKCVQKGEFYVDNEMNNVRAIINSKKTHVSFFCLYSNYVEIVDSILEAFAAEQSLVIESWGNTPTN